MIELTSIENSDFLKMPRRTLTGNARWKDIEDLINRWAKRNPQGALMLENYIKSVKIDLKDKKHGLMGGKADEKNYTSIRVGVALHPELMQYIEAFYPNFLSTKEDLQEFKKRFPKFKIAEK